MANDPSDTDIYDFVDEAPARPATINSPVNSPKKSLQKPSVKTLSYQTPPNASAQVQPDAIKNLYMPLWLLVGGIVVELVAELIRSGGAVVPALTQIGLSIIIGVPLMLAGMLIAVKFRGIQLGSIGTAAFKLCALSIAPAAAGDLAGMVLNHIPLGGLVVWAGEFVLYFALLGALFDLDESDTWYCICVIFLVQLGVYFGLAGLGAVLR